MATAATLGRGTKLQVESATPGVYTTIPEVKDITPPSVDSEEVEVTNQDSSGRSKEFIAGAIDYGEAGGTMNYIPGNATQQQVIADAQSGNQVTRNYRILLPGATRSIDFAGWMKTATRTFPVSGAMEMTLGIRVTSSPVENAAP